MKKKTITIMLVMLLSTLTLSVFSINTIKVSAVTPFDPPPTLTPYTNATWGFDNHTIMGWNMEFFIGDPGLPLTKAFEVSFIYNVSLYYGNHTNLGKYFYNGLLQEAYFDLSTNKIQTNYSSTPIVCSLTNLTDGEFYFTDFTAFSGGIGLLAPPFIPYNETIAGDENDLLLSFCANGLANDPILTSPSFLGGGLTQTFGFAPDNSWIRIENASTGFYVEYVFYNNGTLKKGTISGMMEEDDGMGGTITQQVVYNITRKFDFNPIDEIKWGVNIGDTLYYGMLGNETKFEVIGIRNETVTLNTGFTPTVEVVQFIDANMSVWQSSSWVLLYDNISIGVANEHLLFSIIIMLISGSMGPISGSQPIIPFLVPVGTTGENLAGFFSMIPGGTMILNSPDIKYKFGYFDHGFTFSMTNTTNPMQKVDLYLDHFSNGVLKAAAMDMSFGGMPQRFVMYFKNYTSFSGGDVSIEFTPVTQINAQILVNISLISNTDVLFSAFEFNPFNQSDPDENLPDGFMYIDLMLLNPSALNVGSGDAIIITIQLDKSYENLKVWYFNTNTGTWEEVSYVDLGGNKIMISVDHASIYGLSGSIGEAGEEKVPFGNTFVIFMVIGILTLLAYTYKKRKYKN